MKRTNCGILAALFLLFVLKAAPLQAFITYQDVSIASSPNPVGSGARAIGMGGAFIAVADDATAASWNPAGLIQLERPELSLVADHVSRKEDFASSADPEIDNSTTTDETSLNYFSASFPFRSWERNMVVSMNYQRLYDFRFQVDYRFERTEPQSFPFESLTRTQDIDYSQDGRLGPLGLAYAIEITPRLSLGLTVNVWRDTALDGSNGWKESYRAQTEEVLEDAFGNTTVTALDVRVEDDYSDFSGENINFGILWNPNHYLTIGAVVKTPFTAHIHHTHIRKDLPAENYDEHIELDMPLSYGLGLAFRFSDAFTLGLDAYRTEWRNYMITDEKGNRYSAIDGRPESDSDIKDTTQARIGLEYLFIQPDKSRVIPIRSGFFYDPEPMNGKVKDFYGITLGSGIGYKHIIFDLAYQLRWGRNIDATHVIMSSTDDVTSDVAQHSVYASVIYHF